MRSSIASSVSSANGRPEPMPGTEFAAVIATFLIGTVVAFQLALAAGLPWGEATMGGRATTVGGVLSPPYRLASAASAALLAAAALIVLARGGVISIGLPDGVLRIGAWVVVAFAVLNTLSNLAGRHPVERFGMSAMTLVIALLAGGVALS